jgi:hypothetical protein
MKVRKFRENCTKVRKFREQPNLGVGLLKEGWPELHPGGGAHVQQAALPCRQQVVYHDF